MRPYEALDLYAINKIIDVKTIILIPIILQTYLSDILAKNNNSLHSSSFINPAIKANLRILFGDLNV